MKSTIPVEAEPEILVTLLPRFRPTLIRAQTIMLACPLTIVPDASAADIDWRCPSKAELSRIIACSDESETRSRSVGIFEIPRHLRDAWWKVGEEVVSTSYRTSPTFQSFIKRLAEFLRYKRVPLAKRSRFDVILAPSNGIMVESGDQADSGIPGLAINLGEGRAHAVFNMERLKPAFYDAPLVRLTLAEGEGLSVPPGTAVHWGRCKEEGEAILVLKISPDAAVPSEASHQRCSQHLQ